ncbi:hypothetical protein JCM17823_24270 [Halorubrum gandharaense]
MSKPEWSKILDYLYTSQETVDYHRHELETMGISRDLSIDGNDLRNELDNMVEMGIIDKSDLYKNTASFVSDNSDMTRYTLSQKGFDVAHERQQKIRSEKTNKSIRNLTVILAIAALIQAISTVATVEMPEVLVVIGGSMVFLIIGLIGLERSWF